MSKRQALRDPTFRGKFVCDSLVWPPISLHVLKKLTEKGSGDGSRHLYRPADVRRLKLAQHAGEPLARQAGLPPLINCRMAKGGTGKTTVAANVGTALAFMGYRVLLLDGDSQASLTKMMGIDPGIDDDIRHLGHLMEESVANRGRADFEHAIRPIFPEGMLDLIAADISLTNTDTWLILQMQREKVFQRLLSENQDFLRQYDVIVVDSPPGTSLLSMNIMLAAQTQLAVCWLDRENLKALPILLGNVTEINQNFPEFASDVEIVANGYSATYKHSKEALELFVAKYPQQINETIIQQFSGFHRQQSLPGQPAQGAVVEQQPTSQGAKAMIDLTKSLLGRYRITLAGIDESIPSVRGN